MTTTKPPQGFRTTEQTQFVIDAVRSHFQVSQEYLTEGGQSLQFFIDPSQTETKANFLALLRELEKNDDLAFLRNTDHGKMIMVIRKPPRGKSRVKLPVALFIATLATIFIYGALWGPFNNYTQSITQDLTIGGIFTACLMGIIGIHELGHKVAAWHHKMDSSWPYFIPFPPIPNYTLPTFGAVISARDPPPNKDALFDLGFSGPIAGLLTTIVVSVFAATTAKIVPIPLSGSFHASPTDMYTGWITNIFHYSTNGLLTGSLFTALYFAYSLGFLLTFVNLLPAWQLDGGHIANAAVSQKVHQYLTWISAGIMLLTGFWLMAILVLALGGRGGALRPLDDVSTLSRNRKLVFCATWIIAALIFVFVIYENPFFYVGNIL
jgi:membrane-associated protease RseP (regulator of RpoE activity)